MDHEKHLYMILFPNNALVASQLSPKQFAQHYTAGSSRHYQGKVIFAEVDVAYRDDFFRLDEVLPLVTAHADGRPKATKFVASYRVLEHVEFSAIMRLYLTTQEGYSIGIDAAPFLYDPQDKEARIFAEIAPMRMLVLSRADFGTFGKYITEPSNPKSAPNQFYTQLDVDIVEFLKEFEENPFRPSPFPNVHPSILREGFKELMGDPNKLHKGISLNNSLDNSSYKLIRRGFMFANQKTNLFFPMPQMSEIEKNHFKFWRTM